ncbi:hypothetical protein [Nocardia salmonicida]
MCTPGCVVAALDYAYRCETIVPSSNRSVSIGGRGVLASGYGITSIEDDLLPSEKIAIAVICQPQEFSASGTYSNGGDALFAEFGAYLTPDDAPPDVPPQGGS